MHFLLAFLNAAASTPAPSGGNSSLTQFVALGLGAGGLGAIVAAIVAGIFSKKKLGAEATEIITKAAASVVTNLEAEIRRQVAAREVAEVEHTSRLRDMASAHVAERADWQRVLQLHVAWDAIAIARLGEIGIELPPTPPLLPAQRHVDESGFPIR